MTTKTEPTTKPRAKPKSNGGASAGARKQKIMSEAAKLFSSRGFEATTIRDIAAAAGILGGSIYYHFASKEDIFLAVHSAGMESITEAVVNAIEQHTDPWERLEAAAVAHCEALLATSERPIITSPYYSASMKALRRKLVAQRDKYEKIIIGLVDELDLPEDVDRDLFRLHFLGALNWVPAWYRKKGSVPPAEIGRQLVAMLRRR